MTTIALYGGSFNPPHLAHVLACVTVLATQPVDQLWLVPSFKHPFDKAMVAFEDRLEMCRQAVAGLPLTVSDIERTLGTSRTYDTLVGLGQRLPGARFRLVIGADILGETDKWHRWHDVVALAPPILIGRQGFPGPPDVVELPAISSTDVRARLAAGQPVDHLVPRAVLAVIEHRGLYRAPPTS